MAMAAGIRLELRQTQGLVLTPQLQQAIRLLQLSNLELSAVVDREVAENPFLDRLDAAGGRDRDAAAAAAAGAPAERPFASPRAAAAGAAERDDGWRQPPAARAADCALGLRRSTPSGGRSLDGELPSLEARLARPRGLREHLLEQLAAARAAEARETAATLIDCLDQDGYLREADDELAALLAVPAERVRAARALLQACDPPGVGARDLAECLALQLRERDRLDPAMRRLLDNLGLLARAELAELSRRCGVDAEDLQDMVQELRRLEPRPARAFAPDEPLAVIPDVLVAREPGGGGGWRVELNTGTLPRLLVDRAYHAEIARGGEVDREARDYLSERLQSASWLAKALDQRARTMLRVARAVFAKQRPFLERGASALRPLVLREIAEVTGLHESTVSRATAGKYAATPHGTMPLKFFFTTAIAGVAGEEAHSAEALRQHIRRLVEREGPGEVLSDDQIVVELRRRGAVLARRTVAKYRESLGIPSSLERRRAKALAR